MVNHVVDLLTQATRVGLKVELFQLLDLSWVQYCLGAKAGKRGLGFVVTSFEVQRVPDLEMFPLDEVFSGGSP